MESSERQVLRTNIEPLAKSIDFFRVAQLLLIRKTFNESMIDHIMSYPDDFYRNIVLISDLQTRGPTAYQEFIGILELTGSIEALRILSPNSLVKQHHQRHHPHYNNHRPHGSRSHPLGVQTHDYRKISNEKETEQMHLTNNHASNALESRERQTYSQHTDEEPLMLHWHPYTHSSDTLSSPASSSQVSLVFPDINSPSSSAIVSALQYQSTIHDANRSSSASDRSTLASASNVMLVRQATVCHGNTLEDYKMTAKPRGPCLIINNIDFDSDLFPQRKGSDYDATRLVDVFSQLGFDICHERNLTAKGMKKALKRIRSKCKTSHDALVVIILSHGSESGIYGSDGIELDFNHMIDLFDNRHCKIMIGKPKIFIIQACRGRLADYGRNDSSESTTSHSSSEEPNCPTNASHLAPHRPPPFARVNEFSKDKIPTRTDMLFCFSCLPGYVSVRNEVAGSWLGVSLSYHLMTEAWDKDLLRILAMISGDIKERISSEGHVEAVETTCLGWSKYLYFNPGIYR